MRTVSSKSPCATAATARVTSRVGQSKSSIRVLTEFSASARRAGGAELHALLGLTFLANHLADAVELLRHAFIGGGDLVESVGNLPRSRGGHRLGERKIAGAHRLQRMQEFMQLKGGLAVLPNLRYARTVCTPRHCWAVSTLTSSLGRSAVFYDA